MKINKLDQSNYGFKSEKKEETKPTVEANEPQKQSSPVNPEYYKTVNAIHFRGSSVLDGIKHTEQKKSMTVDGSDQTVKSYKKDRQEYLEIDDKVYRLRYSKNPEKNAQTVLASRLYNLAGVETPEMKVIDNNGMYAYASEYTDNLSPIKYEPQKAYETYAVDAWLGNWNAYNDMNTALTADGKVIKLVTSGSLQYRASGMKKESFDKNVPELETLKDPQVNPNGSVIFQDMTEDDLINSLEKVINIKKNDIILAVNQSQVSNKQEIIDTLLQRQDTLRMKLEELRNSKEEIKPDPAVDTVEEPETIEQTEPNKTVKSFPKRPYQKAYHPTVNMDFIPQKDKDKANAKLDEYLAADFSKDEDKKDLQWTFKYYSHNYPAMKDYIAYLKDNTYISKYNEKVYFSERAFANGSFPAIVKLATVQENYRYKNYQEDIVNLNNEYIPTGYLNEKVFVEGNEKVTDIIADYKNRQERYTSMLGLAKEYDLKPAIEENLVRSLQDEYCDIPAYKLDVFDYMMKVNKDLFLEPYNSYTHGGARCLASDILRACDTKEKADKFIDETLKEYQEMVPEFDRRSIHDIKELLNTKDEEFSKKKILTLRQMYFDEVRYGGELQSATQEDIDTINYLNSDIDIAKIPDVMWACRYYDDNTPNPQKHYDKASLDFAKEYAVKLKEKGYDKRAYSLYKETINNYNYVKNTPEQRKAIVERFDRILDSGLLDIFMQDRKPLYNNSYCEDPKTERGLTDDEINCLIDLPEDKREFILSHLDIEGRNYQFSIDNLIAYSELDDDTKQKIKDYRLENEPRWGFADVVLLGRESKETLELLKERNLLVPTKLTNMGYLTGTIEAYTNIELSKLSDEDWKKFNDRDLFNRQVTIKYKTDKEEMSKRHLGISEAMILLNLSDKEFNEVVDSGMLEKYDIDAVIGKIEFSKFKDKDSISDFNINEKRELLNLFIKYNNNMFGDEFKALNSNLHFLPKDSKDYCKKLQDISNSLGSNHKPISEYTKTKFYNTLNRIQRPNSEFMQADFTKPELKIDLEYSREDFIKNVSEKLSDLSEKDRQKVLNYYGFELKNNEGLGGNLTMSGYPVDNYKSSDMSDFNYSTAKGIEAIKSDVERFSEYNKIKPNAEISQSLADDLNDIIKVFPEFLTVVGKANDGVHDLSIDVDSLAALQNVMKNPDYQKLSDEEKQILQISTLLKDLTKLEGHEDKTHAQFSAFDAYNIVEKLDLPREKRLQVYELIKNHEFLENYRSNTSKDYAFNLRQGNSFLMETILVDAGLKSIEEKEKLKKAKADINPLIDSIQKTGIILPQTKIPKADELRVNNTTVNDVETYNSKGKKIKNRVIKLEPNMNLKDIGFKEDISSEDLNVIVHGLDAEKQSATLQVLGKPDSDALLSASYVNYGKGNYHVFRQYGFILDVASDDINAAYFKDFGSGYGKSLNNLKSDYLFDGYRKEMRNYISDKIKKELNLSDEEYKELYPKISNKSITELEQEFPDVASAYRNVITNMEEGKRSYGREYNEMLVSRPQIQGIFYQGTTNGDEFKIENVPEFLREYAEEHNVPIIYFGK